ncbi:hypothetical protein PhCBS80983_g05439 [Powellomyces hirtus]|uniref:Cytokinin riboside 5'-monophosphate phosphoribohydrolase n=1 Tax=Powellomyces hirtus TaxID=109895 RepID=A0A507DU73_9FUNG|nr:hypothetical protein PhCBS80983_g05439 [Powellomyces hirtus]
MPAERLKAVCVFCGSSAGKNEAYVRAATELGTALVENGLELVYGGGNRGLMGAVAASVAERGGVVTGFIPETMTQFEGLQTVGTVHFVPTMHARKAAMAEASGAFVALPGGFGTFEELLEMVTWSQLRLHDKPVAILNTLGFYDPFLALLDRAVEDGFIAPVNRGLLIVKDNVPDLLAAIIDYTRPENAGYDLDWSKAPQPVVLP